MPDPVIGSASRHGRLTASPGGALTGRDRPLQCETVSKATWLFGSRTQEVVGADGGPKGHFQIVSLSPNGVRPGSAGASIFEPPSRAAFLLVPAAC